MAFIPCPDKIVCGPGAGDTGVEFPYANLSSEQPDRQSWIGEEYGFRWWPPPIGSNWTSSHCLGVCVSYISQEDADLCALINNLLCNEKDQGTCTNCPPPPPVDPPVNPPWPPAYPPWTGNPIPAIPGFYTNNLQTCTVLCPDGSPFTFQVAAGMFAFWSQEGADRMAYQYACTTAAERLICLSDITGWGCTDDVFYELITATAPANTTIGWSIVSGALPPGLSLTAFGSQSAIITGIPTTSGSYTFRVRALDSLLNYMEKTYTIAILGILNTSPLADGTQFAAYNAIFVSAGLVGGGSYGIVAGALPNGMTLDASGLLFGTPAQDGDYSFTVRVTDTGAAGRFCDKTFTLHVDPSAVPVPEMWYPFEELLSVTWTDTVNGLTMVHLSGTAGTWTATAGKVGARALLLRPNATLTIGTTVTPSSTELITSNGFTLTGWVSVTNFSVDDSFQLSYYIYNGTWNNGLPSPNHAMQCFLQYRPSTGVARVRMVDNVGLPLLNNVDVAFAPVAGTFYWFRFGYDLATGRTFLSINNAAQTNSGGAPYFLALAHTTGRFEITVTDDTSDLTSAAFDEWNFTNGILDAATIADFWNGGAGRTFP